MKPSRKGLTLSELMLAVAILAVVIAALLSLAVSCLLLNESNNNLMKASNDAQYVLEQIKALAYSGISGYAPPAFNNLPDETIVLTRSVGSHIAEVTVNVGWQERQRQRSFQLTTRIAK